MAADGGAPGIHRTPEDPETQARIQHMLETGKPCVTETVDNKMERQIQDAYIVAATRTPVAKRKGMFRNVRPDDLLAMC